jgi:tetratricopeptide (TPR) repeat protein
VKKSFDPDRINQIFNLVASTKDHVREGALMGAMAKLAKALQYYIGTPMLKKEKEVLETEFYDLLLKISGHQSFASTFGPVSFRPGEHKENLDFLNQLIKFAADDIQDKIKQGLEMLEAGQTSEAWDLFHEVMENPDVEIKDFLTIGDAYLKKQMWEEAQEVFSRAMERDPDSLHLMNRMAISLRKDGKFKEALEIYRKAILLSPRDEGLYYNIARLFLDMGKHNSAGQALRKSLAINSGFEPAAKLLASITEKMAASPKNAETA